MQKQATLLIAGTCIGGGTIALPMVLAKLGIIPSLIMMICIWFFTYRTSLVSVELNLHLESGTTLGQLGKIFSGKIAEFIGVSSIILLSYALLAVYVYGGTSILQKLIQSYFDYSIPTATVATSLAIAAIIALFFPIKIVSRLNSILFLGLIALIGILTVILITHCNSNRIPWVGDVSCKNIISVITVIFTSFGYQVLFHTLRNYCGKNVKILKNAFLYGSLILAVVYIVWTSACLSVVYNANSEFYTKLTNESVDVGDLINALALISNTPNLQTLIWWLSILTITTSILGVGLSLAESINSNLKHKCGSAFITRITSSMMTIIPAYVVALLVPNAFLKILGFAGTILVVIAVLLPIYLLYVSRIKSFYIDSIKNKWMLGIYALIGIGIMLSELLL